MQFARRIQVVDSRPDRIASDLRARSSFTLTTIVLLVAIVIAGLIGYMAWLIPHQNEATLNESTSPAVSNAGVNQRYQPVQNVNQAALPPERIVPAAAAETAQPPAPDTTKNTTHNSTGTEATDDGPHHSSR